MHPVNKRDWVLLVCGDLFALAGALYATLLLRYLAIPSYDLFVLHFVPFSILSIIWVVVFIIAGLYDKHTTMMRLQLPDIVLRAQVANILIAAAFFFLVPYFGITPKTNLFIFLVMSSFLIVLWRLVVFPRLGFKKREKAILIGTGKEMRELYNEVNPNPRYTIEFVYMADTHRDGNPNTIQQEILKRITKDGVATIVADLRDKEVELMLPLLYNLSFVQTKVDILDMSSMYEDVFERVPISMISHEWFVEHIAMDRYTVYDIVKRVVDVIGAFIIGLLSLPLYALTWVLVYMDDKGPLFIFQERVGQGQRPVRIAKFRTMTGSVSDDGDEVLESKKTVTKSGAFLRKTRIDEIPQLWSVFVGDLSLIGPRPELPALASVYGEKIPHYTARYLVKPGLSGWAQLHHQAHPHHGADVTETKVKLSYDLYYLKHRSLFLDLLIGLRTIQIILSRAGK